MSVNRAIHFYKLRLATAFALLLFFFSTYVVAQQAQPNHHKHVPSAVSNGQTPLIGSLAATQTIQMSIMLPVRNQASLTALLSDLYNPASPNYRHFLSVQEFTDQFAPTQQDYERVTQWAQSQGFTLVSSSPNRLVLDVSGSVAQVNAALNVSMNLYRHPTENRSFYSPDREPTLNPTLPITHIEGLNDFSLPHPMVHLSNTSGLVANVVGSGPGGAYLGSDIRAAYYGGSLLTGVGQCVGLFEIGGYRLSDVNLTFSNAGQSYGVPINNVLIDGATAGSGSDDSEQVLDIVQAIGMAPNLSQVRVYIGPSGHDADIFNSMATENACKQLSVSWSWAPDDWSSDDGIFQEFATQGQSVFVASGDNGAYDAAVSPYFYPAEDAYVTAVGGTHLVTNYSGGPWVAESAWNSPPYGSGGGISPDQTPIPSWQQGLATYANGGSNYFRNVPDVAMEADQDNYYCALGTCGGAAGGTSFAAPRWAGFMALINQQATETGKAPSGGLGFINPTLYSLGEGANYSANLHDVTTGNDDSDNQPVWYSTTPGYDLVTGWGSPNGPTLITSLAGSLVSGFWISTAPGSLPIAQGSTAKTTVSVGDAGGFSGSVSLSASGLPPGVTASFNPSTTASTSVLTLSASSSATLGAGTVTVAGTSGSATSKTPIFLMVNTASIVPPPAGGLGSVNIGAASSSTPETVTFATAGTLGTISVLTQGIANLDFANSGGGSCSIGTAYAVNATCSVNVTFTPKYAGTRYGAVVLADASGNVLAKLYLVGSGSGPQATFTPGTQSTIGSGFVDPQGAALLGDGSLYVADYGAGGTGALYFEKSSSGTYTQSTVNCSLKTPVGVAVDGSGTLYVTDPGGPSVYKIALTNGNCSMTSIGSGFGKPWGIAVDGNGDVYLTDLGTSSIAAAVYKETLQANGTYVQSSVGSGWVSPAGVAVDSNGRIDVADDAIPGVFMETPSGGSYVQTPIGQGWTAPAGIAVDGMGNIYVSEAGNSIVYTGTVPASVYKEVAAGGTYVRTAIGSGWVAPAGISVQANGNLYVADQTRGILKNDLADAPSLTLANTVPGVASPDSPQTITVSNLGTTALQFASVSYPRDFPETTGVSSDCASNTSLGSGSGCTLSIEFLPTASLGANTSLALSENVGITTNTLGIMGTQQAVQVGGTEVLATGAVGLSVSANPAAAGVPITFTATVAGSTGGPTPTGTVSFYNGTTLLAGPVSLSNGIAIYATSSLPVGTYTISASYSGDSNYQASNSVSIVENIASAPGSSGFGNTSLGSTNVGSTSSVIPLTITFSVAESLGNISVLTNGAPNIDFAAAAGGTCAVGSAYTVNTSCTVNVTFTPKYSGVRYGAVVLADNSGNTIGTGYLEAVGTSPQIAFSPGTLTSVASGLGYPQGVAVDGASNLYVADASNSSIYKETLAGGTYAQSTLLNGFNQPFGIAIDGAGNLYVADAGAHAVYKETPLNGTYVQTQIGSGFASPSGVAVDAMGNVYVADFGNGTSPGSVYLESLSRGTYTQSTIGSGFVSPQGIAVDSNANVFIADSANGNGNASVYELIQSGASYNQTVIGSGWATPTAIAIDGSGNLYVTDNTYDLGFGVVIKETLQPDGTYLQSTTSAAAATPYPGGIAVNGQGNLYIADNLVGVLYRDDLADPPALNFATTTFGVASTDSPKVVTVQNIGNAPLAFSALSYTADFPEVPGVATDCTSTASLVAEATCTVSIKFDPSSLTHTNQPTPLSESVSVTTNTLNTASTVQPIAVSGIESAPLATVTVTLPVNISTAGTSITATAVVQGPSGVTVPSGSVTFYSNGSALSTVPLSNGSASYPLTSLAVGSYAISAAYSGDQNYASATSSPVEELVVPTSTFGTQNIGSTSSAKTVTIQFSSKQTLGSIAVVTQGAANLDFTNTSAGTCKVGTAYSSGSSCTVTVVFKPMFSGARYGAVVLGNDKGALITTAYLEGIGVGPQIAFPNGAHVPIGTGQDSGCGLAVDGSGDVYAGGTMATACNPITKWTWNSGTYTQSSITTSTLKGDNALAVDGAGDLYVADPSNNRVLKESLVAGAYIESTVGTGLNRPTRVAVDGAGNVYILNDSTTSGLQVLKESLTSSGGYTQTVVPTSQLSSYNDLAVDGSGNVYVSDIAFYIANGSTHASPHLWKETPNGSSYTETAIESATDSGYNVFAVDRNGDVFYALGFIGGPNDSGSPIYEAVPSGTGYVATQVDTVASTSAMSDLAVDGGQNIYGLTPSGTKYQLLKLDHADAPSLAFAATPVGATSTDSPKTIPISNAGTAALTFAVPASGANPSISSNFLVDSISTCPQITPAGSAVSLSPGNSCFYGIDFRPTAIGTISGSAVLTDNALNAVGGAQTFPLSGTGTQGSNGNYVLAVLTMDPNGVLQGTIEPNARALDTSGYSKLWVDQSHKTMVLGAIYLQLNQQNQPTCTISSLASMASGPSPLRGTLSFTTENYELGGGMCPGVLYPFTVARYTWGAGTSSLQDSFVLQVRDQFGHLNEYGYNAELAKVKNSHAVWNVCGDPNAPQLPTTATVSLTNPPANATSYTWTIVAPNNTLSFSNGQSTITTTTNSATVQASGASGVRNDISIYATVTSSGSPLDYGPLKTWVRRPNQLQLQNTTVFGTQNDGNTISAPTGYTGYETDVVWQVNDQFGGNTYNTNQANANINELLGPLTTPTYSSYPQNNWANVNRNGEEGWTSSACTLNSGRACFSGGRFTDHLFIEYVNGNTQLSPLPQDPPPIGGTFSTQLVVISSQAFYAGDGIPGPNTGQSPAPYQGCEVQTDTINMGIDHATINPITSPILPAPQDNFAAVVPNTVKLAAGRANSSVMAVSRSGSVLGSVPDVGFWAKDSTLVVKGRVLETHLTGQTGTSGSPEMAATIQVDSVLKGSPVGDTITVEYPASLDALQISLSKDEYGLFFLRSGDNGRYLFDDPTTARMLITSRKVSVPVGAQSVTDSLEAELSASLSDSDHEVALTALKQIGNLGHGNYGVKPNVRPDTVKALQGIAASGDPTSRSLAYTALIRLEDYSLLQPAIEFVESGMESEGGDIVDAISEIGEVRLREAKLATDDPDMECPSRADLPFDSSVLPALHSLLSSPNIDLRRSAAHALRGICDPSSAAFLANALQSNDLRAQYDALQGLAALEDYPNERPAPATNIFNANPSQYVNNWRSWWRDAGSLKYAVKH